MHKGDCSKCSSLKEQRVSFDFLFNGAKIKVVMSAENFSGRFCQKCAREEFDKKIKKYSWFLNQFMKIDCTGNLRINWSDYFLALKKIHHETRDFSELEINQTLVYFGKLTLEPKNAWGFSDDCMNPRTSTQKAYFISSADAIEYAKAMIEKKFLTGKNWYICQIGNYFTKEEVLKS